MRHTSHISCDGGALTGNLVLFLVDSCIPARQWTDICNTRCSILSRFSHFHVSHFPPLQHGAAFSCPAISCLAFSASPIGPGPRTRKRKVFSILVVISLVGVDIAWLDLWPLLHHLPGVRCRLAYGPDLVLIGPWAQKHVADVERTLAPTGEYG